MSAALDHYKAALAAVTPQPSYVSWRRDNSGLTAAEKSMTPLPDPKPGTEVAKWDAYRVAVLAGQRPTVPTMATARGNELVDLTLVYIDAEPEPAPAPPPPPPPPPPAGAFRVGVIGNVAGWGTPMQTNVLNLGAKLIREDRGDFALAWAKGHVIDVMAIIAKSATSAGIAAPIVEYDNEPYNNPWDVAAWSRAARDCLRTIKQAHPEKITLLPVGPPWNNGDVPVGATLAIEHVAALMLATWHSTPAKRKTLSKSDHRFTVEQALMAAVEATSREQETPAEHVMAPERRALTAAIAGFESYDHVMTVAREVRAGVTFRDCVLAINDAAPDIWPYVDGIAIHPYAQPSGPELRYPVVNKWRTNLKQIGHDIPFFITEIGWPTGGQNWPPPQTLAQQQAYLAKAAADYKARGDVRAFMVYDVADYGPRDSDSEHWFGVLNVDASKKPAWSTVHDLIAANP